MDKKKLLLIVALSILVVGALPIQALSFSDVGNFFKDVFSTKQSLEVVSAPNTRTIGDSHLDISVSAFAPIRGDPLTIIVFEKQDVSADFLAGVDAYSTVWLFSDNKNTSISGKCGAANRQAGGHPIEYGSCTIIIDNTSVIPAGQHDFDIYISFNYPPAPIKRFGVEYFEPNPLKADTKAYLLASARIFIQPAPCKWEKVNNPETIAVEVFNATQKISKSTLTAKPVKFCDAYGAQAIPSDIRNNGVTDYNIYFELENNREYIVPPGFIVAVWYVVNQAENGISATCGDPNKPFYSIAAKDCVASPLLFISGPNVVITSPGEVCKSNSYVNLSWSDNKCIFDGCPKGIQFNGKTADSQWEQSILACAIRQPFSKGCQSGGNYEYFGNGCALSEAGTETPQGCSQLGGTWTSNANKTYRMSGDVTAGFGGNYTFNQITIGNATVSKDFNWPEGYTTFVREQGVCYQPVAFACPSTPFVSKPAQAQDESKSLFCAFGPEAIAQAPEGAVSVNPAISKTSPLKIIQLTLNQTQIIRETIIQEKRVGFFDSIKEVLKQIEDYFKELFA